MTDLSLVSIDELWAELHSRHHGAIFVGIKYTTDNREDIRTCHKGGTTLAIGLAHHAIARLISERTQAPNAGHEE